MDVVSLTRKLLTFNTVNPPGNEAGISKFVGEILCGNGFNVKYPEFAENRWNQIDFFCGGRT